MFRKLVYLVSFVLVLALVGNAPAALVSQYKLDNDANDSVGTQHGTLVLGGEPDAGGYETDLLPPVPSGTTHCLEIGIIPGQSFQRINVPTTTGMSAEVGTVAIWARHHTDTSEMAVRYLFGGGADGDRLQLYMDNSDRKLDLGLGDSHTRATNITTFTDGVWYHVALTWDDGGTHNGNGVYVVYVNGQPLADGSYSGFNTFGGNFHIGNNGDEPGIHTEAFAGRLDEVRLYSTVLSEAEIRGLSGADTTIAWKPRPSHGAENLDVGLGKLVWNPGDGALETAGHYVYFGTSESNLTLVTTPSQPQDANDYAVSQLGFDLGLGETYYWRIDEANTSGPVTGDVWSFSMEDSHTIDNFGSYVGTSPPNDPNLEATWTQGGSGGISLVYHTGSNTMQLNYDDGSSPFYSTASRAPSNQDLTDGDAVMLELEFVGEAANDGTELYVELEDNSAEVARVKYGGATPDVNAVQLVDRRAWQIDLQEFVDDNGAIDLTHITKFTLGTGDGVDPSLTVDGNVYFDNIVLYPIRCYWDPGLGLGGAYPDGDFNQDCVIDFRDFVEVANDWLTTGMSALP